jgi:hypothetical protein
LSFFLARPQIGSRYYSPLVLSFLVRSGSKLVLAKANCSGCLGGWPVSEQFLQHLHGPTDSQHRLVQVRSLPLYFLQLSLTRFEFLFQLIKYKVVDYNDDADQEYKAVDYNGLTGVLIEAVKELKAQNEELRSRIEALERA